MWSHKTFKKVALGFGILVVLLLIFVHGATFYMHYSDDEIHAFFDDPMLIENYQFQNREIRVISEQLGPQDSLLMVFVHGAPGSWDAFKDFIKDPMLNRQGRLIAYDRPGYGGDLSMPDIDDQTDALMAIINKYRLPRVMLVGHSYGATIVGNLACKYPHEIDKSFMIAPLLDPESEPLFWYSYLVYWRITKWMAPKAFRIAGDEKFAHAASLKDIQNHWQSCQTPIIHIHGTDDSLAPFEENIAFSVKEIPTDQLEIIIEKDVGHLLIWTQFERIKNIILDRL